MKTLLAIINNPEKGKNFIRYAIDMGEYLSSNVHLIYVQEPINYPVGSNEAPGVMVTQVQYGLENLVKIAEATLKKHIDEIVANKSNEISVKYTVELGSVSVIAELLTEKEADMMIIEDQNDEGFWTQTPSNNDMIRNVNCPVWIIPNKASFKPFSKIIYASDYNAEDIFNLKRIIALLGSFSPGIIALHVSDSFDFEERVKKTGFNKMLQEKIDYGHISVKLLREKENADVAELVTDYALQINANLIVVIKENKSFIERIFKSDTTSEILKKSMLPVLIFHEPI